MSSRSEKSLWFRGEALTLSESNFAFLLGELEGMGVPLLFLPKILELPGADKAETEETEADVEFTGQFLLIVFTGGEGLPASGDEIL
jgi:hypothetical protein